MHHACTHVRKHGAYTHARTYALTCACTRASQFLLEVPILDALLTEAEKKKYDFDIIELKPNMYLRHRESGHFFSVVSIMKPVLGFRTAMKENGGMTVEFDKDMHTTLALCRHGRYFGGQRADPGITSNSSFVAFLWNVNFDITYACFDALDPLATFSLLEEELPKEEVLAALNRRQVSKC